MPTPLRGVGGPGLAHATTLAESWRGRQATVANRRAILQGSSPRRSLRARSASTVAATSDRMALAGGARRHHELQPDC
jgi:hypothetical protein